LAQHALGNVSTGAGAEAQCGFRGRFLGDGGTLQVRRRALARARSF